MGIIRSDRNPYKKQKLTDNNVDERLSYTAIVSSATVKSSNL